MKLLNKEELFWSAVVANANMNRGRNAIGINSYERDIKFNPLQFLVSQIKTLGKVTWIDLCCGEGRALIQTALLLNDNNLQSKAKITGIDLVDYFAEIPTGVSCIDFLVQPLETWMPEKKYDLITCVHGLHYIGDKLGMLQKCLISISNSGLFVTNFDINSIHINGVDATKYMKGIFKRNGMHYHPRTRILTCSGPRELSFDVYYLGANDKAGPNYTGQAAVDAYYSIVKNP